MSVIWTRFFSEYQDVPNIKEPLAFASFIETFPAGAFMVLLFAQVRGVYSLHLLRQVCLDTLDLLRRLQ
jgi:hypothetical protein